MLVYLLVQISLLGIADCAIFEHAGISKSLFAYVQDSSLVKVNKSEPPSAIGRMEKNFIYRYRFVDDEPIAHVNRGAVYSGSLFEDKLLGLLSNKTVFNEQNYPVANLVSDSLFLGYQTQSQLLLSFAECSEHQKEIALYILIARNYFNRNLM